MERPNLSAIRAKLFKVKDDATQDIIGQLLNYVEELEKKPIPPKTKVDIRGMRAKEYAAEIELSTLPFDQNEKQEERLPTLVQKTIQYASYLEKRLNIT